MTKTQHTMVRVADVLAHVRGLGLSVRYDSDYQEFRVNYRKTDSRWTKDSAYFTPYRDDAMDTATAMARA